jgi:hypothetical protein
LRVYKRSNTESPFSYKDLSDNKSPLQEHILNWLFDRSSMQEHELMGELFEAQSIEIYEESWSIFLDVSNKSEEVQGRIDSDVIF